MTNKNNTRKCFSCGAEVIHERTTKNQPDEAEYDQNGEAYCPKCWDYNKDQPKLIK